MDGIRIELSKPRDDDECYTRAESTKCHDVHSNVFQERLSLWRVDVLEISDND